ncbi:MAG: aldehyde dehydrogenase family protein [Candidatus Dormibacteraeota bacterium]|nr:aldehyde dehydrogenase family protein [Candidatus Dormibacteraeota bacterium]
MKALIGGEWRSGRLSEDRNPARPDEVVAEVELADAAAARDAVESAHGSAKSWAATPAPARGEILRRAADVLEAQVDEVAREFAREEGKTLPEAAGETRRAVAILRYFAAQTLEPEGDVYPSHSPRTFLFARREPVGVVLAITPWNFPIAIPAWKIAPALAYGNAVVWKPAELTPAVSVRFCEALVEAGLPPGVLNLVLGKGSEVGDTLVGSSIVDAVSFTGSNLVGNAIQAKALEHGAKVQLELGGKNPAVVLDDADLDLAAEQVARGAFLSTGQKCTATSRVIVDRKVAVEFEALLVERATGWRVGDPLEALTRIGPLVSEAARRSVLEYIEQGSRDGGRLVAGGRDAAVPGSGYFVAPTVFADLPHDSGVVREEIFGPVVALLPASGYEEAVALANDTQFGLSASLFTTSLGRAMAFSRDASAGVVKVNQESAGLEFQVPFGGYKGSSSGSREQGKAAREFYTQWKTVYMDSELQE